MKQRTWVIIGATSIIAEQFAHLAAQAGCNLRLVGRNKAQLELIAEDIMLRYQVGCEVMCINIIGADDKLITTLKPDENELDLFLAHSDFTDNNHLNHESISQLIKTNILATTLLINDYLFLKQNQHHIVYLSSVAACRGRAKNSLYGASKAAIEVYLQGLQQAATPNQHISIARLGFIDTRQTYGLSGIFYAAPPQACAKACWKAIKNNKRMFYFPGFWRILMAIITRLPFFLYKKINQ